jgi:hypothetical protein
LEWTWKEAVVAYLRYCSGIYLEVQRKTTKTAMKSGVTAEI